MAHDVFISYSTKDKTIADTVCSKLEEKKIRCWIAPRDVPPGENFSGSIIDAIETSKVFILIWSSNTNTSDHILNELNQAFDSGITVIPFRVEDIQPSKSLKYYIGRTHWLDAITPPLEQHIDKLAKRITHLLVKEEFDTNLSNDGKEKSRITTKNQTGKRNQIIFGVSAFVIIVALVIYQVIPFLGEIQKGKNPQSNSLTNNNQLKICQVTDFGGIEGEGFGYTFDPIVWDSIQQAVNNKNVQAIYFESHQVSDFAENLLLCKEWGAKLIFAVGFKSEMQAAVVKAAQENPEIYYASIDGWSGENLPNQMGMLLSWDQGAFLAGYLSASMTKTGKVGTFAGKMIPVIQKILDGYYLGISYYNQEHNTNIQLLGYDPNEPQQTYLMENWTSLESALAILDLLISDGADVFFPVCGYVAVESVYQKYKINGTGMVIGTDYDMSQIYPEYSPVVLASVVKRPDVMVIDLIDQVSRGEWKDEGDYPLSLENGGLALVYGEDWINKIPSEVKKDIFSVIAEIKSGTIITQMDGS